MECIICKKRIWFWQVRMLLNPKLAARVEVRPPAHWKCVIKAVQDGTLKVVRD